MGDGIDNQSCQRSHDPANRSEDPVAAADAEPQDVPKQLDAADAEVVAGPGSSLRVAGSSTLVSLWPGTP